MRVLLLLGLKSAAYEVKEAFAASSHTHNQSDIDGLEAALGNKVSVDTYNTDKASWNAATNWVTGNSGDVVTKNEVNNYVSSAITDSSVVQQAVESAISTSHTISVISGNVDTISGKVDTMNDVLSAHTANTDIHVTTTDKQNWNAASDWVSASGDSVITVNNIAQQLQTATTATDTIISAVTTSTEFQTLSAASHTHTNMDVLSGITAEDIQNWNAAAGGEAITYSFAEGDVNGAFSVSASTASTAQSVAIHGLGSAAYANSSDFATPSDIATNTAVTSALTEASEAKTAATAANTAAGNAVSTANAAQSTANAATAVTAFMTGHNTANTLTSIPTTKRLVICNLTGTNENNIALNGTLADGYEIHCIINNNASASVTIAVTGLQSPWKVVGSDISIPASTYGELNIISDGTYLYVRGV